MIIEHVHLYIRMGQGAEFEQVFQIAQKIIRATPGFIHLSLLRHKFELEHYLLQVHWETLEHHTKGFRQSEAYVEWKRLLHPFYEPMPVVEYFEPCMMN